MSSLPRFYIGEDDCRKASCNYRQEFPEGDSPYCLIHALEEFMAGGPR